MQTGLSGTPDKRVSKGVVGSNPTLPIFRPVFQW